jgi:hypothetical protein
MPPPLASWATTLDLSALPDDLAESARSYLGRWASLTPTAQADLGGRIASAVAAVVTPPPPPDVPAWAYLSAVLAERRRRASGYAGYPGFSYSAPPPGYAAPAPPPPPPAAPAPEVPPAPTEPPTSPFALPE